MSVNVVKTTSMDPIKILPLEIVEQIFANLRGYELKRCFYVSTEWSNYIASSLACMKKFEFKVVSAWVGMSEGERQTIANNRKYQNIRVHGISEISDSLVNLMNPRPLWKSVTIGGMKFSSASSFMKLVETFEETVTVLELYGVNFVDSDVVTTNFQFKRLKSLTVSDCGDEILTEMLTRCSSLKSFKLLHPKANFKSSECVVRLLKQNKNLKKFHCDKKWINYIFSNASAFKFPFQLEKFCVTNFMPDFTKYDERFNEFLRSQRTSIKKFQLGDLLGCDEEALRITFQMTSLKEITIFHLPLDQSFLEIELPASQSIEKLDLMSIDIENKTKMVIKFLKSMPNLKFIILRTLNMEVTKFMAENLKSLVKLIVIHKVGDDIKNVLSNVEIK